MPIWTASAIAACIDPPGPGQVTLWTGANFDEACNTIDLDGLERRDFLHSADLGLPTNDSISSIRVGSGVRAVLFQHANLTGHPALFESNSAHNAASSGAASLGPLVDNRTSSIKLIKSTSPIPYLSIGSFPRDFRSRLGWTSETQGLCHTRTHWYITTRSSLWQVPLDARLDARTDFRSVPIPPELQGDFDHMGDPACLTRPDTGEEYVIVPLEAIEKKFLPRAAIFKPVATNIDPIFVNSDEFFISLEGTASWVAFDSGTTDEVWTSGSNLPEGGIQIYKIYWPNIEHGLFFFEQGPAATRRGPTLTNKRGNPLDITVTQGGVFSGDGSLFFLSNGAPTKDSEEGKGIWVFDRKGVYAGESGSGYGPFNFECGCTAGGGRQEPEGMDWFPTSDSITPGVSGQLHVVLLNNETFGDDTVFLKHYAVPAEVTVYAGYLNNLTGLPTAEVPNPFDSDVTTHLISSGGVLTGHDTGVVRFENLTSAAVTIDRGLRVTTEQNVFQIWDEFLPVVLDPGKSLVLAETINFNFDTSDFGLGVDPMVSGSETAYPFHLRTLPVSYWDTKTLAVAPKQPAIRCWEGSRGARGRSKPR